MAATYPKRPSHFAHTFTRLLIKACVANELGAEAALLLIAVAHTEDAKGYRGPVTFHNGQFLPLIGVGSEVAFKRIRSKCEEASWLVHQDGSRSKTPAYWVTIPAEYFGWDDGPTDETPADYISTTGANGSTDDPQCDLDPISKRTRSELHPIPKRSPNEPPSSPDPDPDPRQTDPQTPKPPSRRPRTPNRNPSIHSEPSKPPASGSSSVGQRPGCTSSLA